MAALALLCACDDATDPAGLAESVEAEAVRRSAAGLPSLPALIAEARPAGEPERAVLYDAGQLWVVGSAEDSPVGRSRRQAAARRAAPILAAALPTERWDAVEAALQNWLAVADRMLQHLRLPELDRRVRAGHHHLDRAHRAAPADRPRHLLLAAAELVDTTPRMVARRMLARAEAALATARPMGPATDRAGERGAAQGDRDLQRARRLKDWAAQAVEGEDYLLAIQRAYYAAQLVEDR